MQLSMQNYQAVFLTKINIVAFRVCLVGDWCGQAKVWLATQVWQATQVWLRNWTPKFGKSWQKSVASQSVAKTKHMPTKLWLPNFGLANCGWEPNSPIHFAKTKFRSDKGWIHAD